MRKILLASAALVLSAGTAMATAGPSLTVTLTVDAACSAATFTDNSDLLLPIGGTESAARAATVSCNGTGANEQIQFDSSKGGVRVLSAGNIYAYKVLYGETGAAVSIGDTGGVGASTLTAPVGSTSNGSTSKDVKVQLTAAAAAAIASAAAGTYTDLLTISIAP